MQTELILTVVGDDRPGMVQDAANCVREVGGNWLESRMTRLAGKFAGVVHYNPNSLGAPVSPNVLHPTMAFLARCRDFPLPTAAC